MKPMPCVFALLAALSGGCAGTVVTSRGDAAAPDTSAVLDVSATLDVRADAGSCALPDGRRCPVGATCPAGDGCNTCACSADGSGAQCTLRGCLPPDAGPRRCRRREDCAGGEFCQFPEVGCAAEGVCAQPTPCSETQDYCACDGTAFRGCVPDRPTSGTGRCATAVDAGGPRTCRFATDCAEGIECHFSAPGCGIDGVCAPPRDCATIAPYCGCDGVTFRDCLSGVTTRPYRAAGECPGGTDGGTPDRCAGAHIGRSGRYCAGPADEALPIDCCQWNCDQRTTGCESLPPRCPAGEVNTVVGACWGPCVPPRACMPIPCGADGACPPDWRCDASARRCVPNA